ncbi:MAG: mannitol-1-phosphate 5-dehydrogenase [Candidatus Brocadiae bacterium]|nr:mannitol-1-phosphate 5-dehydrogenase [Candidatus Brocadiia bacterium]
MKTALHFGAGKIGRGFLGQLYCQSGWETVFVDVVPAVVAALNERHGYDIELVNDDEEQVFPVTHVRAIDGRDTDAVAEAVATCDIASTAVGVRALPHIVPPLAAGLARRAEGSAAPLNVVVCENLLDAAERLRHGVLDLADDATATFVRHGVGFVATVVSRMVPDQEHADPLRVSVEPYAILPVDATAFVGPPPAVQGFLPVDNIRAHEERKLFCHNLGHALCAYLGYPQGHRLTADAITDMPIRTAVVAGLAEAAQALISRHGFDPDEYDAHVRDLLRRFANRALGDTVARVARDPIRKLGRHDRLVGAAQACLDEGIHPSNILQGIRAAVAYDHPDDPQAARLQQMLHDDGPDAVLTTVCGLQPADELYLLVRKVIAL